MNRSLLSRVAIFVDLVSCHCCGLIQRPAKTDAAYCARCQTRLRSFEQSRADNVPAASLALAAIAFFPLALLAPFLRIERLGYASESSLLGGVRALLEDGHYAVGLVVLFFSVILPMLKLGTLLTLSASPRWMRAEHRAITYRAVEQLGRWGMVDVLLVAVLVAFVKLGDLVAFEVGVGLYLFVLFVVLNLAAGIAFNPHALWDETMESNSETAANATQETRIDATPQAISQRPTRRAWWLVAVFGVLGAITAAVLIWPEPPHRVVVTFADGHGLRAGDAVRYRGIVVGEVEQLALDAQAGLIDVTLQLSAGAKPLARQGTSWWIVRPAVSLTGADGLETLLGSKYITMRPGEGASANHFVGLERPPLSDLESPGGLDIVVQATSGPRLQQGAGVFHRGVRVGGVRDVQLASDASAIEYAVYVRPEFAPLMTSGTKFWNTGGMTWKLGMDGLTVRVDSIEEIISGGMAIAVPADGAPVAPGTRFILHEEPEEDWLEWRPTIESSPVDNVDLPTLVPFTSTWTPSGWFSGWLGKENHQGVAVLKDRRYFVPSSVLKGNEADDFTITVWGKAMAIHRDASSSETSAESAGLVLSSLDVPEDTYLVTAAAPRTLSAAQWVRVNDQYQLPSHVSAPDGSLLVSLNGEVIAFVSDRIVFDASTARFVELRPRTPQ